MKRKSYKKDDRTCEPCGKNAYESEATVIRWALIRSRVQGKALRYYRCPHGNGWHLTSRVSTAQPEKVPA